jgi:hypothetical protein
MNVIGNAWPTPLWPTVPLFFAFVPSTDRRPGIEFQFQPFIHSFVVPVDRQWEDGTLHARAPLLLAPFLKKPWPFSCSSHVELFTSTFTLLCALNTVHIYLCPMVDQMRLESIELTRGAILCSPMTHGDSKLNYRKYISKYERPHNVPRPKISPPTMSPDPKCPHPQCP